jgi:hypothetical protein
MLWFPERGWKTIMLEMFNFVQLSSSQQWRGPDSNSGKSSWCDPMPASKFIPMEIFEIPRCWCCARVYIGGLWEELVGIGGVLSGFLSWVT